MAIKNLKHAEVCYFTQWTLVTIKDINGGVFNFAYYRQTYNTYNLAYVKMSKLLSVKVDKVINCWEYSTYGKSNTTSNHLANAIRAGLCNGSFVLAEPMWSIEESIYDEEEYEGFFDGLDSEPASSVTFTEIEENKYQLSNA